MSAAPASPAARRRSLVRRVSAAVVVIAAGGLALPSGAEAAPAPRPAPRAAATTTGYTDTKTLTRTFTGPTGDVTTVSTNNVTVSVDRTTDLRGRQRVRVSWTGAKPSGGRASNPYGENGLQQEYPVMVMQCRGTDDPTLPVAQQVNPSTCWTGSVAERSQLIRSTSDAVWVHDADAVDADKQRVSGIDPFPGSDVCPGADTAPYYTHLTPFVTAAGKVFPACNANQMPPEAAVGSAFPPNEISAFTDTDGSGSTQFEVRSDVENESLGCNDKTACTIEVIPIVGISCDQAQTKPTAGDKACRRTGRFQPGSSNFTNDGIDAAVGPALWWSASNWANRFSVPITFGAPPDTCDLLDPRAPTGFYGSELLAQAGLQWAPAYCLNQQRFKFQLDQMPDQQGFDLMEGGDAPAAVVSSEHDNPGPDPVGYAPTAVTGFGIGYIIDKPDNAGEYTDLKLDPRLLAKLLTQSYLGSDLGRGHPGIGSNPLSIMSDPEFIALNPGLSTNDQEAAATVLSLSNPSDVIKQLTAYIAQDKDAMDFIHGDPDPWGMVVNPSYQDLDVPTSEFPLLDTYVPQTQNSCRQQNPSVYFNQLAAPVSTLRVISNALIDAWPNVQTKCDFDPGTNTYKIGRIDRQSFGSRFMLGLVSLGDADRFGLRTAALQAKSGTFVAPSDASLSAAVGLMKQTKKFGPFALSQAEVAKSATAYPGTMAVYTASKLRGANKDDAAHVAQFIRISTTEGQVPGSGNGQLPGGFLPIRKTGPTAKLYRSAQEVAVAVAAQKPAPTAPSSSPTTSPSSSPSTGSGDTGDTGDTGGTIGDTGGTGPTGGDLTAPSGDSPSSAPSSSATAAANQAATEETVPVAATVSTGSGMWGHVMVWMLVAGLVGLLWSAASRFFVRPPRGPM